MTQIPLSRSYLHTPWPIAAFNVMSKPGGGIVNKNYYDALGRVTETIAAYVDGVPSNDDDQTTDHT